MERILMAVLSELTSQADSRMADPLRVVDQLLLVVPPQVLLARLIPFSLATLASRLRNGVSNNSLDHAERSLRSELLWVTMDVLRASLTFSSLHPMVLRQLWISMVRNSTAVQLDLIFLPQEEVDLAVAVVSVAVVALAVTEEASVAVAASVVAVASVAVVASVATEAVAVASAAVAALEVVVASEVGLTQSRLLTRASLFPHRTSL